MKAIIPVAGIGTHLRPHTHTQPKPLIPVAGKPILGHIIDNLLQAGIQEMVFIVGYLKDKIQEYVSAHYGKKAHVQFVVQEPRRGLGHAIWVTRHTFVQASEILIILGDTIFDQDTHKILQYEGSVLAVQEVESPRDFGIVVLDDTQYVKELIEKPQIPISNLALVGMYKIQEVEVLIDVLETMVQEPLLDHEEYALTDALMHMIHKGVRFRPHRVEKWFDCGRKQSLLAANRILLEQTATPEAFRKSKNVIIPPVHISPDCEISHSIIGPYVTIAAHTRVSHSIIKESIIGAYAELDRIMLQESIIGNDSTLRGKLSSVNIGDNTELDFEA